MNHSGFEREVALKKSSINLVNTLGQNIPSNRLESCFYIFFKNPFGRKWTKNFGLGKKFS